MPRVYRSMLADGNRPKTGNSAKTLGVRVGNNGIADIAVAANGTVRPGQGGMSVVRNWRDLAPHRIPARLKELFVREGLPGDARGPNDLVCWRLGDGSFEDGRIANDLILRLDKETHGLVEPEFEMKLEEYNFAVWATADQWVIDEE